MDERREWSLQLAGALEHIHSHDAIHRDLNPWNVLVTHRRDVKIGDFGLSVSCEVGSDLNGWESEGAMPLDSSAVESLYSAPELGDKYNHQADVFSLGMTLFVIWHPGELSRVMDNVVSHVEALRETGSFPEGFHLHCPVTDTIRKMVLHDPNLRPSAKEAYCEMRRTLS